MDGAFPKMICAEATSSVIAPETVALSDFPALAEAVRTFRDRDPAIRVERGFIEPAEVPIERASLNLTARERPAQTRLGGAIRT
jgi:hypothetical protein